MVYALLFPGQASQQVGMGADFRRRPEGEALFAAADRLTGLPISRVAADGPLERLTETRFAQPAIVATSLAAWAALRERLQAVGLGPPAFCAGHSVGELAALSAAGSLAPDEALALVARRSQLMAEACAAVDGTMAAVLGLDEASLRELCREASEQTGTIVDLANINAPDQLVVSGHRAAIAWLQSEGARHGARRVIPLNVGGPFHSVYMQPAAASFAATVAAAPLKAPAVPIVLNQTARASCEADEIRAELAAQVAAPVRWADSLRTVFTAGCSLFLEVGPGQVLAGLVRRTLPDAETLSVQDEATLDLAVARLIGRRG